MLTPSQLHDYQKECILHQLYQPDSMLWLQMGLGKSIITLTAIVDRMRARQVQKTLIIAPLMVVHAVWAAEARKWTHTNHLRFSIMHGTKYEREKALFADADIYLTNYENMNWLAAALFKYFIEPDRPFPFQMMVYDEVSKMKNSTALRMAGGNRDRKDRRGEVQKVKVVGWRHIVPLFKYRTGLTGTPASNGYIDLHGQYLAVDNGKRLGQFITHYKDRYFVKGFNGWDLEPTEYGKQQIEFLISDITKKLDAADYLDIPEVVVVDKFVDIPPNIRGAYKEMEDEMFAKLESGTEVEVFSRSSVSNKLLQFCNGSVYHGPEHQWESLHDVKLDALEDVLEEAAGQPVLSSYTFKPDAERIMERFKKYKPVNLTTIPKKNIESVINKWNQGKIKLMIGHPASMGHGVNGLQQAGSILVWFGLNWSLELYEQMNGRLHRQGQTKPVSIVRILARKTIDLAVADALARKTSNQEGLKAALQRYRVQNDEVSFL